MRNNANRPERFAPSGSAPTGDFAPLFNQLTRPIDRAVMRDGVNALSRWLGAPGWRGQLR